MVGNGGTGAATALNNSNPFAPGSDGGLAAMAIALMDAPGPNVADHWDAARGAAAGAERDGIGAPASPREGKVAILLNGPPRAGKDTAVNALVEALGDVAEVFKFTRPVKDLTHAAHGLDVAHDHFEDLKDTPLPEFGGKTPRAAYISTSAGLKAERGEDAVARLFVDALLESECPVILNPDVGDDMEAELVAGALGVANVLVVRIHRQGHDFSMDCRTWVASPLLRIEDVTNVTGATAAYEARVVALVEDFLAEHGLSAARAPKAA